MDDHGVPADVLSSFFASSRHYIGTNGYVLEGRCDAEGLARAVATTIDATPLFRSVLVERGSPLRRRPTWVQAEPVPVDVVDARDDHLAADDTLIPRFADPAASWDLRRRVPFQARVIRLRDDRTVVLTEVHHAVGDGSTSYDFVRDFLAEYHRQVTGEEPEWARASSLASTGRNDRPTADLATALRAMREFNRRYPPAASAQVVGTRSGPRERLGTTTGVGDAQTLRRLRTWARSHDATITDVVAAASVRAVRDWNRRRGADADVFRVTIPTNQLASDEEFAPNQLGLVRVGATGDDVDDRVALMSGLRDQRRAALAAGIDRRLAIMTRRLLAAVHLPAVGETARLLGGRTRASPETVVLTNVGIAWPEVVDGRPTGRSVLTDAGGLRLVDMVNVPPAHADGALLLAPVTLNEELKISVGADGSRITLDELRSFTGLLREEILAFA